MTNSKSILPTLRVVLLVGGERHFRNVQVSVVQVSVVQVSVVQVSFVPVSVEQISVVLVSLVLLPSATLLCRSGLKLILIKLACYMCVCLLSEKWRKRDALPEQFRHFKSI